MLSKEESKQWNTDFWAGFKNEMRSIPSINKKRINWLNYPSGIHHVYIRMICSKDGASLNYDIQFKDPSIRDIYWEQLQELKKVMEQTMNTSGVWIRNNHSTEGFVFDRIQWSSEKHNYYDKNNWPKLYVFLKEKLMGFDAFYQEFKDILIQLVD